MHATWKNRRLVIAISGYLLALILTNGLLKEGVPFKYGLALLPILPLLYMVGAILKGISEMDEMYRKIHTEAMAFSGLATGFTCFSYLFARKWGFPEFQAEWAFYMMWFYYGLGAIWFARKY